MANKLVRRRLADDDIFVPPSPPRAQIGNAEIYKDVLQGKSTAAKNTEAGNDKKKGSETSDNEDKYMYVRKTILKYCKDRMDAYPAKHFTVRKLPSVKPTIVPGKISHLLAKREKGECKICYCEDELLGLGCAHMFCSQCWVQYFERKFMEKFYKIHCQECDHPVGQQFARSILTDHGRDTSQCDKIEVPTKDAQTQLGTEEERGLGGTLTEELSVEQYGFPSDAILGEVHEEPPNPQMPGKRDIQTQAHSEAFLNEFICRLLQ